MQERFGWIDWAVIIIYMALMVAIGGWVARRQQDSEHFFLGGRSMPAWAVALSVIASSLSAATFIGAPQISYEGNLTYLSINIGSCIAAFIIAFFFVPAFYRANTVTIYGFLGLRFGPSAAVASSLMFLLGRLLASGSRHFMAGIGFALMWYGDTRPEHLIPVIVVLGMIGTIYTACGGIQAVIWTETIQMGVVVGAAMASIWMLLQAIPAGPGEIIAALGNANGVNKLQLINTKMTLGDPYTIWAAVFAMTLFTTSTHGADHDMLQRVMTARSPWRGGAALVGSMLLTVPIVLLFLVIGLLLFVYYQRPDLMGVAVPIDTVTDSRHVFPQFVLNHMPTGLKGLIMAGLFAAAMSTFNSAINAMASSAIADLYVPWAARRARGRGEVVDGSIRMARLSKSRLAVAATGAIMTGVAVAAVYLQQASGDTMINFALGVMAFALAPLLGVFSAALFTRRGNEGSVLIALGTGIVGVLLLQPYFVPAWLGMKIAWPWWWVIVSPVCFLICVSGRGKAKKKPERQLNCDRATKVDAAPSPR